MRCVTRKKVRSADGEVRSPIAISQDGCRSVCGDHLVWTAVPSALQSSNLYSLQSSQSVSVSQVPRGVEFSFEGWSPNWETVGATVIEEKSG